MTGRIFTTDQHALRYEILLDICHVTIYSYKYTKRGISRLSTYESADDLSEDNVFAIEPSGLGEHDVELRAVGVSAVVGHGNPAGRTVGQHEVLVIETLAVNAATCWKHSFP